MRVVRRPLLVSECPWRVSPFLSVCLPDSVCLSFNVCVSLSYVCIQHLLYQVLCLDNCRVHHSHDNEIVGIGSLFGIRVVFIPRYWPQVRCSVHT